MKGQWIGEYPGDPPATGIIDLDDVGDHYEGQLRIVYPSGVLRPVIVGQIVTANKSSIQHLHIPLAYLNPSTFQVVSVDALQAADPGLRYSTTGQIKLQRRKRTLRVDWETDIGLSGSLSMAESRVGKRSDYTGERSIRSWSKFKQFCSGIDPGRYIFRGQAMPWRLQSFFHRAGRYDLLRYLQSDIPLVYRALIGRTRHLFQLSDADQNGAFLNLIQHHGYPTPLLDWTESPFVASFFAYRPSQQEQTSPVRIFMFDRRQWVADFQQLQRLALSGPHLSILYSLAIENDRSQPQQALSTLTNVDDIEGYIRRREAEMGKTYLRVFDLPRRDRVEALRDLTMMGITDASLFPGLDGACQDLKVRNFGYDV